jgi:hypothetical protein
MLAGCAPTLADETWLITQPRVIGVNSEPAEARPGQPLRLSALIATPTAAQDTPRLRWRLCEAPKPSTENNAVSSACLDEASLGAEALGTSVMLTPLRDACARFGPDTPNSGFRPHAPDATGGYYQPVRLDLVGAPPAFHLLRIQCGLAAAASETATEFAATYSPNTNPAVGILTATVNGQPVALDAIPAQGRVVFDVDWSEQAPEVYAYFDPAEQLIRKRQEAMHINWYVDAGSLETAATQQAEGDTARSQCTTWTAPNEIGAATLWVVLRDSRGGAGFGRYALRVVR